MRDPLVSVLLPFYNTAPFIHSCVESIRRQSYRNWELIAVDDRSTDDSVATLRLLRDPRIKIVLNQTNLGAGGAINVAMANAQGEFFAIMDSDDIAYHDRLQAEVEQMLQNPNLMITGSEDMRVFSDEREVAGLASCPRDYQSLMRDAHEEKKTKMFFGSVYKQPTVMIRRSSWGNLRYSAIRYAEDYEMWSRAIDYGRFGDIRLSLGLYRMHPGQTTRLVHSRNEILKESVWKPLFSRYGLETAPAELESHALLCQTYRSLKREEIPQLLSWIDRLERHFANVDGIDYPLFREIVTGKLVETCRNSASLGPAVWKVYANRLRESGHVRPRLEKWKLMARWLVRNG